jgi:hypothetical protein
LNRSFMFGSGADSFKCLPAFSDLIMHQRGGRIGLETIKLGRKWPMARELGIFLWAVIERERGDSTWDGVETLYKRARRGSIPSGIEPPRKFKLSPIVAPVLPDDARVRLAATNLV